MPYERYGESLGASESQKLPSDTITSAGTKSKKSRTERDAEKNDTPRAFSRLFQPYRPPRASEDDGTRHAKRRKVTSNVDARTESSLDSAHKTSRSKGASSKDDRQSSGRSHENAALRKQPKSPSKAELSLEDVSKASKTKLERRMQRMQAEWRLEDEKLRAKRQKEGEDREGFVDEENIEEMGVEAPAQVSQNRKRRKKGREEDVWAAVGTKKQAGLPPERKGLVGLHDVVQAPPRLKRPSAAQSVLSKKATGGLKRQAELSEGRRQVIEGYRAMMKQKRQGVGLEA